MKTQPESILVQFARQLSAGEMVVYAMFGCLSVGILGAIAALIGPVRFGLVIVAGFGLWRILTRPSSPKYRRRVDAADAPLPEWLRVDADAWRIDYAPAEVAEPDAEPVRQSDTSDAEPEPVRQSDNLPAVKIVSVTVNRPVPMLPAKRSREAVENDKLREATAKLKERLDVVREKLTRRRERQRLRLERQLERARLGGSMIPVVVSFGKIDPQSIAFLASYGSRAEAIENGIPSICLGRRNRADVTGRALDGLAAELENNGYFQTPESRHAPDYLLELLASRTPCADLAGGQFAVQSELDNLNRDADADALADDELDISFNPAEFAA